MAPKKVQPTSPEPQLPAVMPQLVLKKQKSYEVEANFSEVEAYLKGQAARYENLVFTPENIQDAIKISGELRGLQISLEKIQKDTKTERFNAPKAIFDKQMDALSAIVGKVLAQIKVVLDAEDQKRIDDINQALESYKEHFQTVYSLPEAYLERVEFKQAYYNKTAKEKDSKADLEEQFRTLKAEYTARAGSEKMIRKAVESHKAINADEQIAKLDRGLDVASILEWIDTEKERLDNLKTTETAPTDESLAGVRSSPAAQAGQQMKTILGVVKKLDLESDVPGKLTSKAIELTYPVDLGPGITELFKELKKHGITVRIIKPEELVGGKLG